MIALRILLAISMLAVLLALFAWAFINNKAVAWFSSNKVVDDSGMTVAVNAGDIEFGDTITLVRHTGEASLTVIYKKFTDGYFYEYDPVGDAYVLDGEGNKLPLKITGLLPTEYLDISVTFRGVNLSTFNYGMSLSDFDDTNGLFAVSWTDGDGSHSQNHSVLGIYKLAVIADGEVASGSERWLATYNASGDDTINDPLEFTTGTRSGDSETYTTVTFRLTVDVTQYNTLSGTTPNLLSEKEFSIGTLSIYLTE